MKERHLFDIAADIEANWSNVNFAARPYLDAMKSLSTMESRFYADSATMIVSYFLANARSWRGEDARRIKAELKAMLGRGA